MDAEIKWLTDLTDAVYFTRDLIKEPVNHLNASALAEEIKKNWGFAGFKVEVLTKGKIEALKWEGFWLLIKEVLILLFFVSWNGIRKRACK